MRAAVPDRTCDNRIELIELPVPEIGPDEVLVEVRAAGMNNADLLHQKGVYASRAFARPDLPDIGGMEMAGTVVRTGAAVSDVAVGDAVVALCARAYADYVAVDREMLLPAPEGLSWPRRGALPMGLLTEFEALTLAGMRPGRRVLVTAATSGVGLIGVQVAKALGADSVIAMTRSPDAVPLLRKLGADEVVLSGARPASVGTVDIVLDHVGAGFVDECVPWLHDHSCVVSIGRLGGRAATIDLTALAGKRARIIGTTWKTQSTGELRETVAAAREQLLPAVRNGAVVPVIAETVHFEDISDGYARLARPRPPGKLVVVFD
jgi:NADPH:quinone reductase-like Zn-dependent oxidoreductase